MKIIGILGGMGPLATVDIFKKIVTYTDAKGDNEHIHVVIDNATEIPDRTNYILNGGDNPLPYLLHSAMRLELMGADVIIMPCNTAHYFYDDLVKYVRVPFLNMIEEAAKEIKNNHPNIKSVGLLSTQGTYRAGVYDKVFVKYNINIIKPLDNMQGDIMNVIYGIKKGKRDINLDNFMEAILNLKNRGSEILVLGCTELPVAFKMFNINEEYLDPTKILALSAIRFVGKKILDT